MDKKTKIEKYLLLNQNSINKFEMNYINVENMDVEIIYSKNEQKLEDCILKVLKRKISKGR